MTHLKAKFHYIIPKDIIPLIDFPIIEKYSNILFKFLK